MIEQNKRPQYKEIKDYILNELKKYTSNDGRKSPIILFDSSIREVIVRNLDENFKEIPKQYKISRPDKLAEFQRDWVNVFLGCLDYLKQSLRKEHLEIIEVENKVIINGKEFLFKNYNEYANKLQEIIDAIAKRKQNAGMPIINQSSVQIAAPTKLNQESSAQDKVREELERFRKETLEEAKRRNQEKQSNTVSTSPTVVAAKIESVIIPAPKEETTIANAKVFKTIPGGKNPITRKNIPEETSNYNMHADEKMTIIEKTKKQNTTKRKNRKKTNYSILKQLQTKSFGSKINDDQPLTALECNTFRENQIIFVSGSLTNKGEVLFTENIETLEENVPKIPIGAFIAGKAITEDKIAKEVTKINRMCAGSITSSVICYEVNNDALRDIEDFKELLNTFKVAEQIADVLKAEYGYNPMICVDRDVKELIDEAINTFDSTYELSYPLLTRTSSRYLDDIDASSDLIIMHPDSDHDQVILTEKTVKYVIDSIKMNIGNKKISTIAA